MLYNELKDEVYSAMAGSYLREGQFIFNYIEDKYKVARQVQYQDGVDCFYDDSKIPAFLKASVERINNYL